ncbi:sulfite exporter TauE/SafE family protein [Delftia acidovorans]
MFDGAYALAGALTGWVVGLTGVGGGALMTPVLMLFFGVAPVTAVATDLWFAAITKLLGAKVHHAAGQVDWQIVRRLWLGSMPAALLVVACMSLGKRFVRWDGLGQLIGVAVMLTAFGLLLAPWLAKQLAWSQVSEMHGRSARTRAAITALAGAVVGVCVSLTSVGAGTLGSLVLLFLYPRRMTPHRLVATDITHAIPLTLVAGVGYLMAGMVDWPMLLSLLAGSIPGVWLGSRMARRFSGRILQLCLAAVLMATGLKVML